MIEKHKFKGCFIGLAIGDASGAPYEGGILERQLWKIIGKTRQGRKRYTDDTQMSIDVAQSFLEHKQINQQYLARTFALSYRWSRGYGPAAATLLKGIKQGKNWQTLNRKKFKEGSLGNGAAMRAPIVALCHPANDSTLKTYVTQSAEITHAHPLAIQGAYLIAVATCLALNNTANDHVLETLISQCVADVYADKLYRCIDYCQSDKHNSPAVIRKHLGNGIQATESCITAIYFALEYRHSPVTDMLNNIFNLRGDTDTIGAIAGGIWGAFNGWNDLAVISRDIENIELIEKLAVRLHEHHLSSVQPVPREQAI